MVSRTYTFLIMDCGHNNQPEPVNCERRNGDERREDDQCIGVVRIFREQSRPGLKDIN